MDEDLRERVEVAAEVAALYNAVEHGGDARVDAVVGPLMGDHPEFRAHGDEVPAVVGPVVEEVNAMAEDERRDRLAEIAPERLAALESGDEAGDEAPLPPLPNVDGDEAVRLRVAPNPNGPWHVGHARMAAVVGTYAERYDGSFLCRFDDTDPETKRPDLDAYDAILEAIEYLGFEPADVILASDRLETYYEHARAVIAAGGAYACACPQGHFSELKNEGVACEHRDRDPEDSLAIFEGMVDGGYDAGEVVLRVRTDVEADNPAHRDWVAFRIVDTPHPREAASGYRCWPMLDFQSAIDDHLTGVTHVIRGIDLQDSKHRQEYLYAYLGWAYPEVVHWGHVRVDEYDVPTSTSAIAGLIEAGELAGWDDPRAPTIASLRRRGIRGGAIVDAMVELGTSASNVALSMSSIYAANRARIDDEADRAFLVRDHAESGGLVERQVVGGPDRAAPPRHPAHEERGSRDVPVEGAVAVEGRDLPARSERVWLKGYGPVRHVRDAFEYTGDDIDVVREEGVPVVHWAPADGPRAVLRTMEGDVDGVVEPGVCDHAEETVVQFERVGFARLDDPTGEPVVAYYAHP